MELGRLLGSDNSYLSSPERGKREPDLALITKWAAECGFELALVGDDHREAFEDLQVMSTTDVEIVRRIARVLPRLSPAYRATLLHFLDLWERAAYTEEEAG